MKYLSKCNKINVIKNNLLNYYMDISNNQINSESPLTDPEQNDYSNTNNILEEYITNILTNQPLTTHSDIQTPNPLPLQPPILQGTPFSRTNAIENDSMIHIMNQLFTVPIPRHSRYLAPYNPRSNLLFQTLNQGPVYKQVLSEKGEDQLTEIKFSNTDKTNNICPIFQITFSDHDMVIELPCKHIFTPDAIKKWLNEEQAICPVCRFELHSKEVKIKKDFQSERDNNSEFEYDETETDSDMPENEEYDDEYGGTIARSRIALIRSLASLASNTQISRRTTGFSMLDQEEEDDLQAAIYASLQEGNNNDSDSNDD